MVPSHKPQSKAKEVLQMSDELDMQAPTCRRLTVFLVCQLAADTLLLVFTLRLLHVVGEGCVLGRRLVLVNRS